MSLLTVTAGIVDFNFSRRILERVFVGSIVNFHSAAISSP